MIKKHPLVAFFILSFTLSWIFWLPLLLINNETIPYSVIFILLGGFGPFISSYIVSKKIDYWSNLKKSIFKFNNSITCYLSALLIPFAILLLSFGIFILLGGKAGFSEPMTPFYFYPLLLLFVMVLGGGLEEPGWRGFALPMLLKKFNFFISSIIIGLLWALWHLPLFFIVSSSQYNLPFNWYLLNAIALSFVFSWLFIKSKRSTWLAIILHGGINAVFTFYPGMNNIETNMGTLSFYAPITLSTWLIVILLLIISRKIFLTKPEQKLIFIRKTNKPKSYINPIDKNSDYKNISTY